MLPLEPVVWILVGAHYAKKNTIKTKKIQLNKRLNKKRIINLLYNKTPQNDFEIDITTPCHVHVKQVDWWVLKKCTIGWRLVLLSRFTW